MFRYRCNVHESLIDITYGSYGEMGFEVIFHTLSELFPPTDMPARNTVPLSGEQFLRFMLVPEACVSLIMEDLGQTRSEALLTRAASVAYGRDMFPEGDNDLVEEILLRRIRARRKAELEASAAIEIAIGQERQRRILKKRPRPQAPNGESFDREPSEMAKKVRG